MIMAKLPNATPQVNLCTLPTFSTKKIILSRLLPWLTPPTCFANDVKPVSGMSWSANITNPIALIKPLKKGLLSTLSKNPNLVKPATKMTAPAMPVTIPAIAAFVASSSSPLCPWSTLLLTTVPTSRDPAASGPTTICGQLPSKA